MIKVVVLSLASAHERRKAISERLGSLGVAFEFHCPPTILEADLQNPALYCAAEVVRNIGAQMSKEEVSCALGHLGIYQCHLDAVDGLVVLEDDAIILEGFAQFMESLADFADPARLRDEFFLLGGQQFLPGEREAVFGRKTRLCLGDYAVHRSCFSHRKLRRTVGYFIGAHCMQRAWVTMRPIQARADDWWHQVSRGVIQDTSMLAPIVIAHPPVSAGQSSIRAVDGASRSAAVRLVGIRWRLALAFRLIVSIFR